MSTHIPAPIKIELPLNVHLAIVAARFNGHIVDELLRGCVERLKDYGLVDAAVTTHRVPGAFELPVAAKLLAKSGNYQAVICLGCVIRGDTPHFEYVAGEAARGIQQVAIDEALPVIFGVLTTETEQQALDRTGGSHSHAGVNAADAAVQMIAFARSIPSH